MEAERHPPPCSEPKEAMFEKPLTPSDVGKLNRLVIPKQHAEKYFPLDWHSDEKGLLLSFEDELGKQWNFRYSYWTSSQSYVLTKGWSRFVKDKHLDAGDIVLFQRHRLVLHRFFIGWKRRNTTSGPVHRQENITTAATGSAQPSVAGTVANGAIGWWTRVCYAYSSAAATAAAQPYHPPTQPNGPPATGGHRQNRQTTTIEGGGGGGGGSGGGNSKRLRLFGVNMECQQADDPEESEPLTPEGSSSVSIRNQSHYCQYFGNQAELSKLRNNHMVMEEDVSFSKDVNQLELIKYHHRQG